MTTTMQTTTSTAATMRAAVYRKFGAAEVVGVETLPTPVPRPNEVLIRVYTSTVSAADYRARSRDVPKGLGLLAAFGLGVFRPRHRVLGMDVAGVIEAVGEKVAGFAPGDEVIAMRGGAFGGHGEYVTMPYTAAITAKPRNLTFSEAVTLVFGGITARAFLNQATIKPGDRLLVNGASGAVGTAAVQLAKQLGAHVTAVSSGVNRKLVTELGADLVIDYTTDDFTTLPDSYDVIVECVGNAPFERVEANLNPGGALLLVSTDLGGFLRAGRQGRRSGKLVTASVGAYKAEDLAFLVKLAESGQYRPVIDRSYDLADIREAHRYAETGRKRGNVVLNLAPAPQNAAGAQE
jgi:NADPH:quinone reductase-like Zn-dependent oxidoreductase